MMATTAISTTSATQDLPTLPEAAVIGSMVDEALTLALASGSSHLPLRLHTASSNSLQQPRLQSEANHATTDEADSQTPANNSSIAPRLASSAPDAETICTLRAAVLSPTLHHAGALHAASSLPIYVQPLRRLRRGDRARTASRRTTRGITFASSRPLLRLWRADRAHVA